jgi:hypothetical protein
MRRVASLVRPTPGAPERLNTPSSIIWRDGVVPSVSPGTGECYCMFPVRQLSAIPGTKLLGAQLGPLYLSMVLSRCSGRRAYDSDSSKPDTNSCGPLYVHWCRLTLSPYISSTRPLVLPIEPGPSYSPLQIPETALLINALRISSPKSHIFPCAACFQCARIDRRETNHVAGASVCRAT